MRDSFGNLRSVFDRSLPIRERLNVLYEIERRVWSRVVRNWHESLQTIKFPLLNLVVDEIAFMSELHALMKDERCLPLFPITLNLLCLPEVLRIVPKKVGKEIARRCLHDQDVHWNWDLRIRRIRGIPPRDLVNYGGNLLLSTQRVVDIREGWPGRIGAADANVAHARYSGQEPSEHFEDWPSSSIHPVEVSPLRVRFRPRAARWSVCAELWTHPEAPQADQMLRKDGLRLRYSITFRIMRYETGYGGREDTPRQGVLTLLWLPPQISGIEIPVDAPMPIQLDGPQLDPLHRRRDFRRWRTNLLDVHVGAVESIVEGMQPITIQCLVGAYLLRHGFLSSREARQFKSKILPALVARLTDGLIRPDLPMPTGQADREMIESLIGPKPFRFPFRKRSLEAYLRRILTGGQRQREMGEFDDNRVDDSGDE